MDNIDKLKLLLTYKNTSQKELAELLGITPASISRWIDRKQDIPSNRLAQIIDLLNTDLETFNNIGNLITNTTAPEPQPPIPPPELIAQLINEINALQNQIDHKISIIKHLKNTPPPTNPQPQ